MQKPRRISASHRDAFLERYQGLHAWAVQMTASDQALAEDLLHDLFILFTLNQPDLKRIENLDSYLYACLRNLHISQLRRATRGRFEQLSIVEYDSARLGLHSLAHGRDWIQVQDELRRICHYACVRKATASAASVLILRFFHGYYPSEIAKVIRATRPAVDKRILAARVEAKAYLENSDSLSFMNEPSGPPPDVFQFRVRPDIDSPDFAGLGSDIPSAQHCHQRQQGFTDVDGVDAGLTASAIGFRGTLALNLEAQQVLDELLRQGLLPFKLTAMRVESIGIDEYLTYFSDSRLPSIIVSWMNGESFSSRFRAAVLDHISGISTVPTFFSSLAVGY